VVRDGIYYAATLAAGGGVVSYVTNPWYGLPLYMVAAFCLYFFRDPERVAPAGAVAVSPADGKVVAVKEDQPSRTRVSIFLNIFDVHVNRSPISGTITDVRYQRGQFLVAAREDASLRNEQNVVTIEGDGTCVVFKQIAGLIARRIVFHKRPGDRVAIGDRVGLIKFGSRVDVLFGPEWDIVVLPGMHVKAGSTVLARQCASVSRIATAHNASETEHAEPEF
jgi:phosphatidylserine decarboxylase